jgi:hypothetical protein
VRAGGLRKFSRKIRISTHEIYQLGSAPQDRCYRTETLTGPSKRMRAALKKGQIRWRTKGWTPVLGHCIGSPVLARERHLGRSNILLFESASPVSVRATSKFYKQVCPRGPWQSFWQCPRRGRASQRRAGRRWAAWPRLASVDGHPSTMERLRPAEIGPAGTRTRASPRGWAEVQLVGRRRSCLCRR